MIRASAAHRPGPTSRIDSAHIAFAPILHHAAYTHWESGRYYLRVATTNQLFLIRTEKAEVNNNIKYKKEMNEEKIVIVCIWSNIEPMP